MSDKKIMFEIFRAQHKGEFNVVYYTELGEHERDYAISEAMNGEHVYSGYILQREKERAKSAVDEVLYRLNAGETLSREEIECKLEQTTLNA